MSICDGCDGDGSCQIQFDKDSSKYSCPINSKWVVAWEKLDAIKTWFTKKKIQLRWEHGVAELLDDGLAILARGEE